MTQFWSGLVGRPFVFGLFVAIVACLGLTGCFGPKGPSTENKAGGMSNKLVGVWEGPVLIQNLGHLGQAARYEIKSNGRYAAAVWMGPENAKTLEVKVAGTWVMTGSEDNLIIARVTDDFKPDYAFGWRVTVNGDDEINLEESGVIMKLKRKK